MPRARAHGAQIPEGSPTVALHSARNDRPIHLLHGASTRRRTAGRALRRQTLSPPRGCPPQEAGITPVCRNLSYGCIFASILAQKGGLSRKNPPFSAGFSPFSPQISMMTGRIIGLRLVFLNRNWLRSFLIVDLMVAQSEMLRLRQTSSECMAIIFIASIRSSLSFI